VLSALPRSHPSRPIWAYFLAKALVERYELSYQKDDLDKSILYSTESLLFSPLSWIAHGPMIGAVLSLLAVSLFRRSTVSKEPEDAIYAARYLRHLRDAPFAFQRQSVTGLLVATLAIQKELKTGDIVQTLQEMSILTHELLASDPSSTFTTHAITAFVQALFVIPDPFPDQPLNQIIECLRLAMTHKPEIREVRFVLAKCLYFRYEYTMNDELDEVASIWDEIISSCSKSPGDKFVANCQTLVADLAVFRLGLNDCPENSEDAIYRACAFLATSSPEDALYPTWSRVLEKAANNRFQNFGPISCLEPSSSRLPSRPGPAEPSPLDGLLGGIRNSAITDIDEAVEKGRSILASSNPNDLYAPRLFGEILFEAFERTNRIEYLDESIDTLRQLLARPLPKLLRLSASMQLSKSLIARFQISPAHRAQDIHGIVELFPKIINDGSGWLSLFRRFKSACGWAALARAIQHPSVLTAYETAFSLMQDSLLFAPTLQLQHATLVSSFDMPQPLPLEYASYQLDLGQLEKAIETLERGRS
jgi:tetratricopeptide (TPR) repeat protein